MQFCSFFHPAVLLKNTESGTSVLISGFPKKVIISILPCPLYWNICQTVIHEVINQCTSYFGFGQMTPPKRGHVCVGQGSANLCAFNKPLMTYFFQHLAALTFTMLKSRNTFRKWLIVCLRIEFNSCHEP